MNLANGNYDLLVEGDEVHFIEDAGSEGLQARRVSLRKHEESQAG
jgi:hypothetical protein